MIPFPLLTTSSTPRDTSTINNIVHVIHAVEHATKRRGERQIEKWQHNKLQLLVGISTYKFGEGVIMEIPSNSVFTHDETDITMISCLLMATESGTQVICIISGDTDLFIMLVYWVYQHKIQATTQMEQFGTSTPSVHNSARNACRFWGCTILMAHMQPHTCMTRGDP